MENIAVRKIAKKDICQKIEMSEKRSKRTIKNVQKKPFWVVHRQKKIVYNVVSKKQGTKKENPQIS